MTTNLLWTDDAPHQSQTLEVGTRTKAHGNKIDILGAHSLKNALRRPLAILLASNGIWQNDGLDELANSSLELAMALRVSSAYTRWKKNRLIDLRVVGAEVARRQPRWLGIWYLAELAKVLSLDDRLLALDTANNETRKLGPREDFIPVKAEKRVGGILASYVFRSAKTPRD